MLRGEIPEFAVPIDFSANERGIKNKSVASGHFLLSGQTGSWPLKKAHAQ